MANRQPEKPLEFPLLKPNLCEISHALSCFNFLKMDEFLMSTSLVGVNFISDSVSLYCPNKIY